MTLRAPFPWHGGKSDVAGLVWEAFGNVPNYVEPFGGSAAVLLARPTPPRVETVNDVNAYLTNFWRALRDAPAEVVQWAQGPVHEVEVHARHVWLMQQQGLRDRLLTDPHYSDAKAAGWWLYGCCAWIGSGWCVRPSPRQQLPDLSGDSGARGRGIHASGKTPEDVSEWLHAVARRLARVSVTCGDWTRVLSKAVTWGLGLTGVFLDPPYPEGARGLYAQEERTTWSAAYRWALDNGDNPLLRIALAGYEGWGTFPASWRCVPWKRRGGYAAAAGNTTDASRERVWFSPHCLTPAQKSLADLWRAS